MATYLVMFRLDYDGNYSRRWSAVMDAIRAEAEDGETWEEMTSVIVLKSSRSVDDIARSIYLIPEFDILTDSLFVVNSSNNTHAVRGKIENGSSLDRFFNSSANALLTALMG